MNMQFTPGSENSLPENDEDDDGRRLYLEQILHIHKEAVGIILPLSRSDCVGTYIYTAQRVRFLSYGALMLQAGRITKQQYKKFAQMQNGDILYSSDFQKNFDIRDSTGSSISDLLAQESTW